MRCVRISEVYHEFCLHGVQSSFSMLLWAVKQFSKDICEAVQAMICDPPYNAPWIVEFSNFGHHRLSPQDMSDFVKLLSVLVDLGSQGHRFCTALQVRTWYKLLVWAIEK